MPSNDNWTKLQQIYNSGNLGRGALEDLQQLIMEAQQNRQDNGSTLQPYTDTGIPDLYYEDKSGLYLLNTPLGIYDSPEAATNAYTEFHAVDETTTTTPEEESPILPPEQGSGFQSTILTGGKGSGLAYSPLPSLRRAGSLLAGLDRTNSYIIA